ncbi:MAG: ABC transporter ATP-binding protein [Gemmatimonadota bacterium]
MTGTDVTSLAVAAAGVGKRFPDGLEALAGVDLQVRRGEFVALLGPSGCGKSTVLRLVAGLARATAGTLAVCGLPPEVARRQGLRLAYVLQDPTLLRWRRVAGNVALPLELRHLPPDQVRHQVAEALGTVGLGDFAHRFPRQLSGGMRMRVSIARALVTFPELLLMDEPFGALDDITRQRLNLELLRLWEAGRWTCLFVTHSVQEACFLSERVMVMGPRPGRILFTQEVPFPHPRAPGLRLDPRFGELVASVNRRLEEALA